MAIPAALVLMVLIPLAAGAQLPPHGACTAHEAAFPSLIGKPQATAEAALRAMPGIREVRAGSPNSPMTSDYHEDRVTLTVVDGRVVRIACG